MLLVPFAGFRRPQVLRDSPEHVNAVSAAPCGPFPEARRGEAGEEHGSSARAHGAEQTHDLRVRVAERKYAHEHVVAPHALLLEICADCQYDPSVVPRDAFRHPRRARGEHAPFHIVCRYLHTGILNGELIEGRERECLYASDLCRDLCRVAGHEYDTEVLYILGDFFDERQAPGIENKHDHLGIIDYVCEPLALLVLIYRDLHGPCLMNCDDGSDVLRTVDHIHSDLIAFLNAEFVFEAVSNAVSPFIRLLVRITLGHLPLSVPHSKHSLVRELFGSHFQTFGDRLPVRCVVERTEWEFSLAQIFYVPGFK